MNYKMRGQFLDKLMKNKELTGFIFRRDVKKCNFL